MQTAAEYLEAQRELLPIPQLPPFVVDHVQPAEPDLQPRTDERDGDEDERSSENGDGTAEDAGGAQALDLLAELAKRSGDRKCWEIEVTRRCYRSWRNLDGVLQVPVLKKLRLLVEGREFRTGVNHAKPLAHAEVGLALFESYLPRGWRLLWEEMFGFSERHACWRDKILLWDVCDHDSVPAAVRAVSERFRRRQAADAATPRPPPRPPDAGGVRAPRELPAGERPAAPSAADEFTLELSALGAIESPPAALPEEPEGGGAAPRAGPAIDRDVALLKRIRERAAAIAREALAGRPAAGGSGDVPPGERAEISAAELELICADGPVLAVGRSGTGKTSCAIVRLWARYHAYWSLGRGAALLPSGHLRAVFLTNNPALLDEVRRLFSRLEEGHALLARPLEGEAPLPPLGRSDAELPDSLAPSPTTLTGHKWLRLVDGTLAGPFFPRPPRARLVVYELFEEELWPALSKAKGPAARPPLPHPTLVWTEFLSLIQGSVESLGCAEGFLDRDAYLALGRNRSRLDDEQRQAIHELYGAYRDAKRRRGLYDVTDAVHHIYREVAARGYGGPPIHEIIVDEVQDFTQAELALAALVCGDGGGLFFCGDTCQTIARGLSFRFCDLRSLFHLEAGGAGAARRTLAAPGQLPIRQLTQNYRSHAGILACSSVVVDMLELLFDREIDVLQRDTGLRSGPPPLLLPYSGLKELAAFLFGDQAATARPAELHLGADQVVVVRGQGRKERLGDALGRSNVLTVEEVKGLEFEDVLLLNFFTDSPGRDERMWREAARVAEGGVRARVAEAAAVPRGAAVSVDFASLEREPTEAEQRAKRKGGFDPHKHRLVATELKHLYTAITRAKRAVWLYDEDRAVRRPIFDLFASVGVAQSLDAKALAGDLRGKDCSRISESTPAEWEARGRQFLERRLFDAAKRAFENAGSKRLAALAEAELELQRAAAAGTPKARKDRARSAAKLFESAGEPDRANDCRQRFDIAVPLAPSDKAASASGSTNRVDVSTDIDASQSVGHKAQLEAACVALAGPKADELIRLVEGSRVEDYEDLGKLNARLRDHKSARDAFMLSASMALRLYNILIPANSEDPDALQQAEFLTASAVNNAKLGDSPDLLITALAKLCSVFSLQERYPQALCAAREASEVKGADEAEVAKAAELARYLEKRAVILPRHGRSGQGTTKLLAEREWDPPPQSAFASFDAALGALKAERERLEKAAVDCTTVDEELASGFLALGTQRADELEALLAQDGPPEGSIAEHNYRMEIARALLAGAKYTFLSEFFAEAEVLCTRCARHHTLLRDRSYKHVPLALSESSKADLEAQLQEGAVSGYELLASALEKLGRPRAALAAARAAQVTRLHKPHPGNVLTVWFLPSCSLENLISDLDAERADRIRTLATLSLPELVQEESIATAALERYQRAQLREAAAASSDPLLVHGLPLLAEDFEALAGALAPLDAERAGRCRAALEAIAALGARDRRGGFPGTSGAGALQLPAPRTTVGGMREDDAQHAGPQQQQQQHRPEYQQLLHQQQQQAIARTEAALREAYARALRERHAVEITIPNLSGTQVGKWDPEAAYPRLLKARDALTSVLSAAEAVGTTGRLVALCNQEIGFLSRRIEWMNYYVSFHLTH
eukprot:tig00000198_g16065.t1